MLAIMDPTDFPPLLCLSVLPHFFENILSCLFFCDRRMDTGHPWVRSIWPYSTTQSATCTSLTPVFTGPFDTSSDLLYLS